MSEQKTVLTAEPDTVERMTFEPNGSPIKGYPILKWQGKRPFTSTRYYPAQIKERHGEPVDGWMNKIYWGDNLQVMSHLLKEYRGKVKLIYVDPPFDSKADYKQSITLRGKKVQNDKSSFEEKQYRDIWINDEYLQFMFERLTLLRELLSDDGTIYVHADWHKGQYLRCIIDDVFGKGNFVNEIIWCYEDIGSRATNYFKRKHDTIFMAQKTEARSFNILRKGLAESTIKRFGSYFDEDGKITYRWLSENNPGVFKKLKGIPQDLDSPWLDLNHGQPYTDWWTDISPLKTHFSEALDYPTQKPEKLLKRIIEASSDVGDLVFDCFMGSGTTQAVAMKLGRRFIGADINAGSVQITTKRLLDIAQNVKVSDSSSQQKALIESEISADIKPRAYMGIEVYNVNHYDVFRNPVEAKQLLLEALEVNPLPAGNLFDGEKDGRMVKVMPVNRIATRADLNELIANFDIRAFERQQAENPHEPVERVTLVCMGHEADLAAQLKAEMLPYNLDVEVVDILRDKKDLAFKRDSEAKIMQENSTLTIEQFYPMNLLQKLSLETENVEDWRELVESVMIDWNYGGGALEPATVDIPEKNELVKGSYPVPDDAGTIRVKITDVLSESLEVTL